MTDAVLEFAPCNYLSVAHRQQLREQIAADTLAFIRQGGSITRCPGCNFQPSGSKPASAPLGGQL